MIGKSLISLALAIAPTLTLAAPCAFDGFQESTSNNCTKVTLAANLCDIPANWINANIDATNKLTAFAVPPAVQVLIVTLQASDAQLFASETAVAQLNGIARSRTKGLDDSVEILDQSHAVSGDCALSYLRYDYEKPGTTANAETPMRFQDITVALVNNDVGVLYFITVGGGVSAPNTDGLAEIDQYLRNNFKFGDPT